MFQLRFITLYVAGLLLLLGSTSALPTPGGSHGVGNPNAGSGSSADYVKNLHVAASNAHFKAKTDCKNSHEENLLALTLARLHGDSENATHFGKEANLNTKNSKMHGKEVSNHLAHAQVNVPPSVDSINHARKSIENAQKASSQADFSTEVAKNYVHDNPYPRPNKA